MTIKRSNIKVKLPEGYLKYRKESGLTHDMLLQKLWTNYRKGGTVFRGGPESVRGGR